MYLYVKVIFPVLRKFLRGTGKLKNAAFNLTYEQHAGTGKNPVDPGGIIFIHPEELPAVHDLFGREEFYFLIVYCCFHKPTLSLVITKYNNALKR